MRGELEAKYTDGWVLIHGDELVGVYSTLNEAGREAVTRFGREGPHFIRQVVPPKEITQEEAMRYWRARAND